ncbi:unnamed protein product [Lepeophtheirus salmonis]|uniref:(salmon louse) hypothetical protein n=1 Tax=Lepeophtheirus salmonis TaxID=72036 RepID=A0A7R8D2V2_LEPSM|nr:unnamed protein product [Lepeophtheirus salmonis]CAF3008851.1 unnamed protein product [Lepeophtheirus salmonis]
MPHSKKRHRSSLIDSIEYSLKNRSRMSHEGWIMLKRKTGRTRNGHVFFYVKTFFTMMMIEIPFMCLYENFVEIWNCQMPSTLSKDLSPECDCLTISRPSLPTSEANIVRCSDVPLQRLDEDNPETWFLKAELIKKSYKDPSLVPNLLATLGKEILIKSVPTSCRPLARTMVNLDLENLAEYGTVSKRTPGFPCYGAIRFQICFPILHNTQANCICCCTNTQNSSGKKSLMSLLENKDCSVGADHVRFSCRKCASVAYSRRLVDSYSRNKIFADALRFRFSSEAIVIVTKITGAPNNKSLFQSFNERKHAPPSVIPEPLARVRAALEALQNPVYVRHTFCLDMEHRTNFSSINRLKPVCEVRDILPTYKDNSQW